MILYYTSPEYPIVVTQYGQRSKVRNGATLPTSHFTFSVVIQRASLDELASSAAARSQTFIVLHREDGRDHSHYCMMTRVVNGACVVATHLQLPLSILLLSTATHLWDGIGLDNSKKKNCHA